MLCTDFTKAHSWFVKTTAISQILILILILINSNNVVARVFDRLPAERYQVRSLSLFELTIPNLFPDFQLSTLCASLHGGTARRLTQMLNLNPCPNSDI